MGDLQRSDRSKECFSSWFRYGCYHFHFSNCWACVDDDSVHSDREIARAAWTRRRRRRKESPKFMKLFCVRLHSSSQTRANWWVSDWPFAWLWRVCSRSEELSGLDLHSWYFLKTRERKWNQFNNFSCDDDDDDGAHSSWDDDFSSSCISQQQFYREIIEISLRISCRWSSSRLSISASWKLCMDRDFRSMHLPRALFFCAWMDIKCVYGVTLVLNSLQLAILKLDRNRRKIKHCKRKKLCARKPQEREKISSFNIHTLGEESWSDCAKSIVSQCEDATGSRKKGGRPNKDLRIYTFLRSLRIFIASIQ